MKNMSWSAPSVELGTYRMEKIRYFLYSVYTKKQHNCNCKSNSGIYIISVGFKSQEVQLHALPRSLHF